MIEIIEQLADIKAGDWNALAGDDYPFLRHEFLSAAEASGCVSPETGWTPCHIVLRGARGKVLGAMPLYRKSHSWGEFVFDWNWAQAYERAGLAYYPKLVSATPFTPAPSRRLLLADRDDQDSAATLIKSALQYADESECSSLHVLFPRDDELPLLRSAGLKLRKDCQFHWHNHGYSSFDEFLGGFSSRKRKKVRQDRRRVAEQGISFSWLRGNELDDDTWRDVYRLISITFMRRGSMPYYDYDFFRNVGSSLPDNILVVMARQQSLPIAAAIFYVSANTLYGRYWGSNDYFHALHFETCYYQGIDYCIEHGIDRFEPGTQGEHKISRGFTPVNTWSAHWLARPEFFEAIGHYLDDEKQHVDRYVEAVHQHSPYRKDPT